MKQDTGTIVAIVAAFLLLGGLVKKALFISPVHGRVSSKYGPRGSTFHRGVDVAVPTGTKVKAPAAGTVARIYSTDTGGKQMIVRHANGFKSGYAHLSKFYFGKGAKVSKGRTIALTGNTGISSGPHLHFSWRKNDKYQNPQKYFSF